MPHQIYLDQITGRVEQLLMRHEALHRANALLSEQISSLTLERDSLRSRLSAARARVDSLIERLPQSGPAAKDSAAPSPLSDSPGKTTP